MHENTTSIKIDMSKYLIYFSDSFPVERKTLSKHFCGTMLLLFLHLY